MVQERLRGIKIDDEAALIAAGYDRDKIASNAARLVIKQVLEDGYFHADPHPGNLLVLPGEVIGLIDFGTVGYLDRTDRTNLIRLYVSLIQFDAEGVVDQLIRIGIAETDVDQLGLIRAMRRLLRKYAGLPLKEISASELLSELTPLIYEFRLHIPSDYWLLIKTLVIMEGVGKKLAPDFDVFEVSGPYVRRFLVQMALPTSWMPAIAHGAGGWANLATTFPRQATKIMGRLERGDMQLQVRVPALSKQQAPQPGSQSDRARGSDRRAGDCAGAVAAVAESQRLALERHHLDYRAWFRHGDVPDAVADLFDLAIRS